MAGLRYVSHKTLDLRFHFKAISYQKICKSKMMEMEEKKQQSFYYIAMTPFYSKMLHFSGRENKS